MNNRVTITFSRDFVAGDSIGVYYSDPSTQTSGYWTFIWVNGTAGTFQVQVGTPTTTTGEIEAIRFASAWTNSLNGFTVTQPVSGNDNQVQITSQTYHFVNLLAKFADGSTMAIPTDYDYVLSTVSTGNKITYEDKLPLNTPAADSKYLWRSVNANEVKTKFNLNDDRIGALETDKANLVGGNDFIGDQTIQGLLEIIAESGTSPILILKNTSTSSSEDSFISFQRDAGTGGWSVGNDSTNNNFQISKSPTGVASNVVLYITPSQNVGIGIEPTEKLEVAGNIKSSGDIKLDRTKKIIFDTDDNQESAILYNTSNTSLDYSTDSKHRFIDNIGQLFTIEANLISLSGSVKTDEITTYNDNTNLELSAHGTGKVYVNDDLGVGTSTPTEKLEVAGNIKIGTGNSGTINFDGAWEITHGSAALYFKHGYPVQTTYFILSPTGTTLATNFDVNGQLRTNNVLKFTGSSRTYADLPSSPSQGMMSYINDASSVSYRATASGGGSDVALVFYDGSNWIYH